MNKFLAATVIVLCVMAAQSAPGLEIDDKVRGFKLTVPDGFIECPDVKNETKAEYAFVLVDLSDSKPHIFFIIKQLNGLVGRDETDPFIALKNKGKNITVQNAKWKSFEIKVGVIKEKMGDAPLIRRNVLVPLAPNALMLFFNGFESEDAKMVGIMNAVLQSLDGKTNWLTGEEHAEKQAEKIGLAIGRILFYVLLVIAIIWVIQRARIKRAETKQTK